MIPILESKKIVILDSLKFFDAFILLSNATQIDFSSEIWDAIRRSGSHKKYADPALIDLIQNYYSYYSRVSQNWEQAKEVRIKMRNLKYELLTQNDLDLFRLNDPPITPSSNAFDVITNEKMITDLAKNIGYSSNYFKTRFERTKLKATNILELMYQQYPIEDDPL